MAPASKILAIALAFWLTFAPAALAEAPPAEGAPGQAARAFEKAADDLDLQTRLPEEPSKSIRPENRAEPIKPFAPNADIAEMLLWISLAVILGVAAYTVYQSRWSDSRARRFASQNGDDAQAAPAETAARLERAGLEADELAALGRFAEAMHVLLLQSVGELRGRLKISIAASLTSREILSRLKFSADGRAAFSDIVGRVEISYFGPHEPGEAEYRACRRSFEMLGAALKTEDGA